MKYALLLILMTFPSVIRAQHKIVSVKETMPFCYDNHDGNLEYKANIVLDAPLDKESRIFYDGEAVDYKEYVGKDTLVIWLPLIGEGNLVELKKGNRILSSFLAESPVCSDWGYFASGTIHIIQSSHQDIAWVNSPEYCRRDRIYNTIIPALDMMETNPDFTFEMEQTLNLMEFLDEFPDRKDEIIRRYREGRFNWGATFNQPYEGLLSGEQLVRQAYFGRKWIKDNLPGCDDRTASNVDVPGRTMQMPQILSKCGIENLFVSRMREGLYDWYSPDGSKVFTFTPGNYGWATLMWHFFDNGAVTAMQKLNDRLSLWDGYFRERNIPPHYAVLISCDATKPVDFSPVIKEWNAIADLSGGRIPHLVSSTSEKYFETVNVPGAEMETVSGERPNLWLYIHGPAHYEMTLGNRLAAVLLPDAEMFSSFAEMVNPEHFYDREAYDRGWKASIYPDHGLGGNFGELTDAIFADSLCTAFRIGDEKVVSALADIVSLLPADKDNIVVFNDLTWKRSVFVKYPVPEDASYVRVLDEDGRSLPVQYVTADGVRNACFYAEDIPAVGYRIFRLVTQHRSGKEMLPESVTVGDNYYENGFYRIQLGNGGIVSLIDKESDRNIVQNEKFSFGDVIENGYCGNGAGEFTRITDPSPGDISSLKSRQSNWKLVESGPLLASYENVTNTNNAVIHQRFTFYHEVKKIDLDITLENFNGAHNRQYRVAFPLDMDRSEADICYEVPMGILEVGRDEMKTAPGGWSWGGTYAFRPEDSHPREVQNFISAGGNGIGFTMSSCVAVCDWIDPSREQSEYPVVQGILLSTHKSCHGAGNWYHQTGSHAFHFSILSHEQGWKNGYQFGIEANRYPIILKGTGVKDMESRLPDSGSFLSLSDPFVAVNAFKKADDGDGYILRITEMEGRDKTVKITLPFEVGEIIRCSMIEEEQERIPGEGRTIEIEIGHHSIETFKIIRRPGAVSPF